MATPELRLGLVFHIGVLESGSTSVTKTVQTRSLKLQALQGMNKKGGLPPVGGPCDLDFELFKVPKIGTKRQISTTHVGCVP